MFQTANAKGGPKWKDVVGRATVNSDAAEVLDCINIDPKKGEDFYRRNQGQYQDPADADPSKPSVKEKLVMVSFMSPYKVGVDGRRACRRPDESPEVDRMMWEFAAAEVEKDIKEGQEGSIMKTEKERQSQEIQRWQRCSSS